MLPKLKYAANTAIVEISGTVVALPLEQIEGIDATLLQEVKWHPGMPFLSHNENVEVALTIQRQKLQERLVQEQS